jgi:bleomycin hydrolase
MVYSEIGIVPEEAYTGMAYGENNHIHGELDNVFKSYVESVVENKNKKLTTSWYNGYKALLNAYFGDYPATFTYNSVEYTPESFASHLDLNISDYIMFSSFIHHPWYSSFILEVPDNWGWGEVYNVKLEELTDIIDYSINQGYTVAWATDVSEKGFSWQRGLAIVPSEDAEDLSGLERAKWDDMSEIEKQKALFNFSPSRKEKVITSEIRQEAFDNYETTDDHGMHITGLSEDQNGNVFYLVKNSWGIEGSPYKGYLYASKAFVQYKTTSVLVHKNAVPKDLKKKIGI